MKPLVAPTQPVTLRGPGVVLREWRPDDVPLMVELFDDEQIRRWTPMPCPFDLAAARTYLDAAREARRAGRRIQLAVTEHGGAPCGEVLLFGIDAARGQAEIGYVLGAAYRGRGLAGAALRAMVAYCRDELGLRRLVLRIDPGNEASVRVARRAGFTLTDEPAIPQKVPGGHASLRTWESR